MKTRSIRATAVALLAFGIIAFPLNASAAPSSCADLQDQLTNSSPGGTVTLQASGGPCEGTFFLPTHPITFEGEPGAALSAPVDGGTILTGDDIGSTSIRNLDFDGGSGSNGGAISITGDSSPTIEGNTFTSNSADNGGALYLVSTETDGSITVGNNIFGTSAVSTGNSATGAGGAVYLAASVPVSLLGNRFEGNQAGASGGGAYINTGSATQAVALTMTDNVFVDNEATRVGGGLALLQGPNALEEVPSQAISTRNRYTRNSIVMAGDPGGGAGAWLSGETFMSRADRFIDNDVSGAGVGWGGGMLFETNSTARETLFTAHDLVVAGNSIGDGDNGAGLHIGAGRQCPNPESCSARATLINATVAGNSMGTEGTGGAVGASGPAETHLVARNSILVDMNAALADISGLTSTDVTYTDSCDESEAAVGGTGNICAAPNLVNAPSGDVHQTATSPTRDRGNNADVPTTLTTDFEGQLRKIDSDSNGVTRVDMGADEALGRGKISLSIRKTSDKVFASGRLLPKNPGRNMKVVLQRKSGGTFRQVTGKTVRLSSQSAYSASFNRPAPGSCRMIASFAGSPTTTPATRSALFRC